MSTISEQKIISLSIDKLKNINGLINFDLSDKPLIAILGANGCGKSTILHALACCYKPVSDGRNHIFSHYFTPTTDASWQGSNFTLKHSYRNGKDGIFEVDQVFSKQTDRWSPKYERRIARHVEFIGIKSCVPKIEDETQTSLIRYDTVAINSDVASKVRSSMGVIFNRNYTELNQHNAGKKKYSGLMFSGTRYSSLSMGAGEQRVLEILNKVISAPKYSLILIDEIDLLLHTMALRKLLIELNDRAVDKSLQIIFTTHREMVVELEDIIGIRHIFQVSNRTYYFADTKPDALQRLTGNQIRPIDIFVEDVFSKAIVEKVAAQLGLRKYISVTIFGAAVNCFIMAIGLFLKNENFDGMLFVLDGDVFHTDDLKIAAINKYYSGTEADSKDKKEKILRCITQFAPIDMKSPESSIHQMLIELNHQDVEEEGWEIINVARQIISVTDRHELINGVNAHMGFNNAEGVMKIIDIASNSMQWNEYVAPVKKWLLDRKPYVVEIV